MESAALRRLVKDYKGTFARNVDVGKERYEGMPDLSTAIWNAACSIDRNEKMESHQRRIGKRRLAEFERVLQAHKATIRECRDFGTLHTLVGSLRLPGIGALAVYDISVRIGNFLGFSPGKVYLHAGAINGAKALGLRVVDRSVSRQDLPAALRGMACQHVENFLCIYKRSFKTGSVPRRPRCGPGVASLAC